ncbi:hypothetical protein BDF19DRAFT_449927 [Syncephalis fuscata]|nr:hypothetical protein BDF19DRAFT_449927 [Syncephalis fuscata]
MAIYSKTEYTVFLAAYSHRSHHGQLLYALLTFHRLFSLLYPIILQFKRASFL